MVQVVGNYFATKTSSYVAMVEKALSERLNKYRDSKFFEPLMYALKGGKRLRPVLLLLSFESVGGKGADPLPAAVAVELAHTVSLIHDDILDEDALRRGVEAFHAKFGYELALLSADFTLSIILDIVALYMNPRILGAMCQAVFKMCEGEFEEITIRRHDEVLSLNRYINVIEKKTASLFEASAKVGAILGGAEEREITALSEYGRFLGIAYQIQDDLSDLDKDSLLKNLCFSNSDFNLNLEKVGCLRERATFYAEEAKRRLNELKAGDAKNLLAELADFIVKSGN